MNTQAANSDRNSACSEVWWPWIGSNTVAMLMPIWVSMTLPAAEIAQNTMPKQKPIAMPMNSSLTTSAGHDSALIVPGGAVVTTIGSATMARLTRKLLRTIAGMFCGLISGSITNAPMILGRVRPSASIMVSIDEKNGISVGSAPGIR